MSKVQDALEDVAAILAKQFHKNKESENDYVEFRTKKIFGKNYKTFLSNEEQVESLTTILRQKHELHLAIEANHKAIFIMSNSYFENMQKNAHKITKEQFANTLAHFKDYDAYMEYMNKTSKTKQ